MKSYLFDSGLPFTTKPGVARRLVTFLLLRQKQSNQKKRRPDVWVPTLRCGQPAVLDYAGGKNNSLRSNKFFPLMPSPSPLLGP
ncbi:MAG: hypothetical protein V4542_12770, partial [Pseudomonadota bacterium]